MIPCEEYGRALYTLASADGDTTRIRDTLISIDRVMAENPAYVKLLDTPAIPTEEKLGLIDSAFGEAEQFVVNFIKILCEKHAVYKLHDCVKAYIKLYNDANNITEASCITARPMTEEQITVLRDKLSSITGKTVMLSTKVDSSLIGGIVLLLDGKQLDGSVKARLDTFRRTLSETIV